METGVAAELDAKHARIARWLETTGRTALLLRRHENLAWATAGRFSARVLIPGETAVAALLVLRDGRRFALLPNNEAARLEAEELPGLGYQPVVKPWHAIDFTQEAEALAGPGFASDTEVDLRALRAPLHSAEIARYRTLGATVAEAVSTVLGALEPGMTEYAMEALAAERLLAQGVFPSVLLMGVDNRIRAYKHAVARGAKLQRFGMLNLCARKWGLAVSVTRFVHFGPMPPELAEGFRIAAEVDAALRHATRPGVRARELFRVAADAYARAGAPGEEQLHHQGGACGYLEREWVAAPAGEEAVVEPQAVAWNPSCRGGKIEDTTLLSDGRMEVLTSTPALPEVLTEIEGTAYSSAGVLLRR